MRVIFLYTNTHTYVKENYSSIDKMQGPQGRSKGIK